MGRDLVLPIIVHEGLHALLSRMNPLQFTTMQHCRTGMHIMELMSVSNESRDLLVWLASFVDCDVTTPRVRAWWRWIQWALRNAGYLLKDFRGQTYGRQ